jgi:hypothetical protein
MPGRTTTIGVTVEVRESVNTAIDAFERKYDMRLSQSRMVEVGMYMVTHNCTAKEAAKALRIPIVVGTEDDPS